MEFGEGLDLERSQEMPLATIEIRQITDGLGYGVGRISHDDREDKVGLDVLLAVESAIEDPKLILVPVHLNEHGEPIEGDGCPDGRNHRKIFKGLIEVFKSLTRPKVFGGGATMVASTQIGMGNASGKSIKEVFSASIHKLKKNGVSFGAHTDDHSEESNSGCGAIDNAPAILKNVVKFREQITSTIENELGVDSTGLGDVLDNFAGYAETIEDQPHAGVEVVDEIKEADEVVKELVGPHLEMYIVLNYVEDYTVNQEIVRQLSDGKVQVFGVDIWRLRKLVQKVYPDKSAEDQHKALLSELVYSLATAATLTKGDLPVFVVNKRPELAAA